MSWGSSTQAAAADAVSVLHDNLDAVDLSAEARAQADAAFGVLPALLAVVDDGTHEVTVSVSGHANPGHAQGSGYANELVSISIYQTDVAVTPPAAPDATTTTPGAAAALGANVPPEGTAPPADTGTAPAEPPTPAADGTTSGTATAQA